MDGVVIGLEQFQVHFEMVMGFGNFLASLWDCCGIVLGSIWDHSGVVGGCFGERSGIVLGSFINHSGIVVWDGYVIVLEWSGYCRGIALGQFGIVSGRLWTSFRRVF